MVGKVTTEGDRAMRSNVARRLFNLNGRGISIGIISDSFNSLGGEQGDIRSGDLPGARNPLGYRQKMRVLKDIWDGSDEGRAMAQIIFDVAPGAKLMFHAGGDTEAEFAHAIRTLAKAGADIIVDDIFFPTETLLQDGISAQAITDVTNQGVLFFSAAGNDGNRSYESAFNPGTAFAFRGTTYIAHNFAAGNGVDPFQDIQISGNSQVDLLLNWDQPSGRVNSDLEMFLLDRPQFPGEGATVLATGTIIPSGQNDASEKLAYSSTLPQTAYLLIAQRKNDELVPGFFKWVSIANSGDGRTTYQYVNETSAAIGGSTVYGHSNAANAIAVGSASYRQTPAFGVNPPRLDAFSSRGGSPIVFTVQGDRLTNPEVRRKPEIIGPNGVSTTLFSFSPFFGTSAAAPHLAAVAALMLQRAGGTKGLSLQQLVSRLQQTAIPLAQVRMGTTMGFVAADDAVLASAQSQQIGSLMADKLLGTSAADNLYGLAGNDRLDGKAGFDALWGGAGNDALGGGAGNDYLLGEAGSDRIVGGDGNDTLLGRRGNDWLEGGNGNDVLLGDAGQNAVVGGKGRDLFVLNPWGSIAVQDFEPGRDRLGLSHQLKFADLTIQQQGQDSLIQFHDRVLAKLSNVIATTIGATDFIPTVGARSLV